MKKNTNCSFDLDNLLVIAEGMILQEAEPVEKPGDEKNTDAAGTGTADAAKSFVDIGITGCIETVAGKPGEPPSIRTKLIVYILPPHEDNAYPSVLNKRAGGGFTEIVGSPMDANTIGTASSKLTSWIKMAPADLKPLPQTQAIDQAAAADKSFFAKALKSFILNPAQSIVKK